MSRVGLKSISLPDKVSVSESNGTVSVEGPKGKLEFQLPAGISVSQKIALLVLTVLLSSARCAPFTALAAVSSTT